jgi:putative ABC transport system substrate-binding protein
MTWPNGDHVMERRTFMGLVSGGLLAAPAAAEAQQAGKVWRVGVLSPVPSTRAGSPALLRQTLRELGYVEGLNLAIEWRDAEGKTERFDDLAAELVSLKVDVIVATVPGATLAAKRSTASIPIVMVNTPDPVQLGLVVSLGRPGGNVTGTTTLSADLSSKQLELLKEAVPRAVRIAVLWNPSNPWHSIALKGAEAAARSLAVQLQILEVRGPEGFDSAFEAMTRNRTGAVLVLADPLTAFHRSHLANLAAKRHLPGMYGPREYADAGGLMSYWAHYADLYRRVASYVDRILKGAKPGDLSIEQPTKFELVINLKTAKALGLTIPQSLLSRADEVIQ